MNPWVVHFYFPIFGTLFIPIDRESFAKAQRLCKICGKPAIGFQTKRAELEYCISMICQCCQNYYFPKEN